MNMFGDSWYRSSRRPLRCRDRFTLDQIERLVVQRRLESQQALVDRQKLDDRRPGVDQVLERRSHAAKGAEILLHDAERKTGGGNGGAECHIRNEYAGLQVSVASDIEIEIVEIDAEIVAADIIEELREGRGVGAIGIVLAEDQLLAVSRLDALVAEIE